MIQEPETKPVQAEPEHNGEQRSPVAGKVPEHTARLNWHVTLTTHDGLAVDLSGASDLVHLLHPAALGKAAGTFAATFDLGVRSAVITGFNQLVNDLLSVRTNDDFTNP